MIEATSERSRIKSSDTNRRRAFHSLLIYAAKYGTPEQDRQMGLWAAHNSRGYQEWVEIRKREHQCKEIIYRDMIVTEKGYSLLVSNDEAIDRARETRGIILHSKPVLRELMLGTWRLMKGLKQEIEESQKLQPRDNRSLGQSASGKILSLT